MKIEPFHRDDIGRFLELAATENWVAELWEFEFLLSTFPEGCFCARDDSGTCIAFVTSIRHERSGWIGNLIVAKECRGRGIGELLFTSAQEALRSAGAETIWLTASKMGESLYGKHGFTSIDTILRWNGFGRMRHSDHDGEPGGNGVSASASGIDCQAWDDRRDALLAATVGRGRLLMEESGFLVIQPCGNAMQFGPFSLSGDNVADQLFDAALSKVPLATPVYLDSPASNRAAVRLFNRSRMWVSGSNVLMYAGKRPCYRPEYLFGLATMGSCG